MLTAAFVGGMFGGGKTPSLYEAFPDLFEKEKEAEGLEKIRATMTTYAKLWNAQHGKKGQEE